MSEITDEDAAVLETLNITAATLSFLGSTFIIVCYVSFRQMRTFAFHLVAMMSISDLFFSIASFLGDTGGSSKWLGSTSALCTFQSITISYFELTSLLWSVSIAFVLDMAFLRELKSFGPNQIRQYMHWFHAVVWGVPIVFTLLPLTTESYGDTGGWCWIKRGAGWRYITFYVPLWIAITYNIIVYRRVYVKLSADAGRANNRMVSRVKYYPLVLIICWSFGTVDTIFETVTGGMFVLWLQGLHTFFGTSQGLANATVYGLTPSVQAQLKMHLPCCGNPSAAQLMDEEPPVEAEVPDIQAITSPQQVQLATSNDDLADGL